MALPTFLPPVAPTTGLTLEPKINLHKTEFGDGYTQAGPAGLNHIREVATDLKLEHMTSLQAAGVIALLRERGGYQPFLWTIPGESTPRRWTCAKWKLTLGEADTHTVTMTLEQDFGIAA